MSARPCDARGGASQDKNAATARIPLGLVWMGNSRVLPGDRQLLPQLHMAWRACPGRQAIYAGGGAILKMDFRRLDMPPLGSESGAASETGLNPLPAARKQAIRPSDNANVNVKSVRLTI